MCWPRGSIGILIKNYFGWRQILRNPSALLPHTVLLTGFQDCSSWRKISTSEMHQKKRRKSGTHVCIICWLVYLFVCLLVCFLFFLVYKNSYFALSTQERVRNLGPHSKLKISCRHKLKIESIRKRITFLLCIKSKLTQENLSLFESNWAWNYPL